MAKIGSFDTSFQGIMVITYPRVYTGRPPNTAKKKNKRKSKYMKQNANVEKKI